MTVGQAPTIDINASVGQELTINTGGGFWHGTCGRLMIAALIMVIVATAVGVTLALVLEKETPAPSQVESEPTPTPSPIENGNCSNAWSLPVDGQIYAGSTVNGAYVSACVGGAYGRGVWYRFIGTGRPITVSTCNENTTTDFTTILSVLSSEDGTCGDDKLNCMGIANGYDTPYYSGCSTQYTGGTLTIPTTTPDSVYYASVIGYEGAVGEFGLMIFDDSPASRRILPEILAPALINEDTADQTDESFTINQGLNTIVKG